MTTETEAYQDFQRPRHAETAATMENYSKKLLPSFFLLETTGGKVE